MDKDGYPTKEELDRIESWPLDDIEGLYAFVKERWAYPQYWREAQDYIFVSTCGWSGNESIIKAMEKNRGFWVLFLYCYMYGGHYTFLRNPFKKIRNPNIYFLKHSNELTEDPPNLRYEQCQLCIHNEKKMDGHLPYWYCMKHKCNVLEFYVCDDYECGSGEEIP